MRFEKETHIQRREISVGIFLLKNIGTSSLNVLPKRVTMILMYQFIVDVADFLISLADFHGFIDNIDDIFFRILYRA